MRIIDKLYDNHFPLYPIEDICDIRSALFIDIETTGLKCETTSLYLIGCGYYTDKGLMTRLFFADDTDEEETILRSFYDFVQAFTHLFHFNGLKFDIPYLKYKADKYNITGLFDHTTQIDIYKLCKPLRYLLFPDSMKQKAIEGFLDIPREDIYSGGELIKVYEEYVIFPSDEALHALITHNREDVLGMHRIMPILYYLKLHDAPLEYCGYRINSYNDYSGNPCEEVIFEYRTSVYLPRSFTARTDSMYVKASAESGRILIRLPIYTCDMKLYFDNWRDYCYIPEEDTAILRAIASTLPKDRYQKATRETCYQRVSGRFVKQPDSIFTPVLRTAFKDKKKYFRFPEDFKEEAAEEFGRCLINIFFTMKKRSPTS